MTRFSRRVALTAPVAAALGYALARPGLAVLAQDASPEVASPVLPVTVTDANGAEVTVTDVSRIVPLSGDIAEIVWDLGLGANIVAVDVSATHPPQLLALPKVGYERVLNAEGILAMEPTVVIGKTAAGPAEVLDQVAGAGVPLVIVASSETIEAPMEKIEAVSTALGVQDAGQALAAKVAEEIRAAQELAAQATESPSAVILLIQEGGVQLMAGGGTVANAMLEAAGATDAGAAAGVMGYQPVTPEALVAAAPEIIVTMAMGAEAVGGLEGVLALPGVSETPAGQNGRVYLYDDEMLVGMTPRTGQQLMAMIADFHPELAAATASPEATPAG
ncbi:MAG: ABC transporter substrate-binding protein [Thermomicrobiales bacterium]|nr:ABC transporter substrate-binding protein [Thermomicrobiales bacterium]